MADDPRVTNNRTSTAVIISSIIAVIVATVGWQIGAMRYMQKAIESLSLEVTINSERIRAVDDHEKRLRALEKRLRAPP